MVYPIWGGGVLADKASSLAEREGKIGDCRRLVPRANQRVRVFSIKTYYTKKTRHIGRFFGVPDWSLAFGGAPRWTIINCPFCRELICFSCHIGQNAHSRSRLHPRLQSQVVIYPKTAPRKGRFFGVPDWSRTNDTQRRRLVLYPTELRIRNGRSFQKTKVF